MSNRFVILGVSMGVIVLREYTSVYGNLWWIYSSHNTERFRKRFRNIPWKYCKIAKIFRNQSLVLLKYCNNISMSAQNMVCEIFSKY